MIKKIEMSSDKYLARSLNLINKLLAKSLRFSAFHMVIASDDQNIPSEDTELSDIIINEFPNIKEVTTLKKHPFKGLASNIKSLTIAPIFSSLGNKLGHLVLLDNKERALSIEEEAMLTDFTNIIGNTVEKHIESQQLQLIFTDFIHKTIHDLKNPLTSISLTIELLKRKADDPKMVGNFSEKLDKANKRLFSNLEELKSAFPINDRSFKLNNTEVNIGELIENIRTETPNINLHFGKSSEITVFGDYNRLKEAIKQLIAHIGSIVIEIVHYINDNVAVIEIKSNESGNDTETSALTISKTLIQMHKGKIETLEKGYAIYLPAEVS